MVGSIPTISTNWMQPDKPSSASSGHSAFFSPPADPDVQMSSLDSLTSRLMTPSKEQEIQAAFSLTPAQYNSITNPHWPHSEYDEEDGSATPVPHDHNKHTSRNIEDAFKRFKPRDDEDTPMVYKRSLLWDRVPADVLREFKRMVREDREREEATNEAVNES